MAETKPADKKVEKAEVKKDEKTDGDKKEGVKKVDKKEPMKDDKNRRMSGRRDDNKRQTSSSSSHLKTSDKPRMATLNKSTGKPVTTSLKRATKEDSEKGTKPSSSANTKEKVSNTQKTKPGEPTATSETVKDKNGKDIKKDILSFDRIKERERQRLRQRQRRLMEQERHQITKLDRACLLQHDLDKKQKEKALRLEKVREHLRRERQKLEKELLQRERYKLEQEFLERERLREEQHHAEMMRLEEMRHSMKRPYEENLWDEPKRSRMSNSSNPSRFELPFQNESHYNEYEDTDDERRVERYERKESRAALESGSRFDERKEREMMRREVGHARNIRDRDERRTDDRSRTDEKLSRIPYEFRRDMGLSRERYIGPDRGRDTDRRNISAHDRLGRMRSSPVGPDQRPWGSESISRKVDSWPHMHGDMDNSGMNRPNDRWPRNPMNTTGRDSTGAFVDHRRPGNSGGMMQNLGHTNMFGNSQSQSGIMMVTHGGGGGNMSGRMQEPRFDAYKIMGSM